MHPYTPLLQHQRVHGWLTVTTPSGPLEVPFVGDAKRDAQLERQATLGGTWVGVRHPPQGEAQLEREAIQAEGNA
jgi:hypothetical protein